MEEGKGKGGGSMFVIQFSSVAQSCPTLCNPMDCSTPGFPVHHQLPELTKSHVHQVSDAIQPTHLILCHPLLLLLSIFPSIRVFSSESSLGIRWPEDWSLSFSLGISHLDPAASFFPGLLVIVLHYLPEFAQTHVH